MPEKKLKSAREALKFLRQSLDMEEVPLNSAPTHVEGSEVAFQAVSAHGSKTRVMQIRNHPHIFQLLGHRSARGDSYMAVVNSLRVPHDSNALGSIFHTEVKSDASGRLNLSIALSPVSMHLGPGFWHVVPKRGKYLVVARTSVASLWRVLKEHRKLSQEPRRQLH